MSSQWLNWLKTNRSWWGIVAMSGLAAVLANLLVFSVSQFGHLELDIHHQRLLKIPLPPNPEIVIVEINKDTPHKLGVPGRGLPLPRHYHATLLRALRDAGAQALVFDLLFLDPADADDDTALRVALAHSQPLQVTLATEEEKATPAPGAATGWQYWFATPVILPTPLPPNVVVASAKAYDPGAILDGAVLLRRDEKTGLPIPHLAFSAVLGRFHIEPATAQWDQVGEQVRASSMTWPVGADGELHARWTAQPQQFVRREYADVLQSLKGSEGRAFFRDKIVLVGDVSGEDFHNTPLGRISGLEFVAHLVNTLLVPESSQSGRWSILLNLLWGVALSLVAMSAVRTLRLPLILGGMAGALALAWWVPLLACLQWTLWIDTVGPGLSILLATGIAGLQAGTAASAQARRFTPNYVREVRPEALTEVATVLFVDLKGSTAMAEKLGPTAAQEILSALLSQLTRVITRHGGEVERTLGDGLMAVFRGQEARDPARHALRCVTAIHDLQQAVVPTDQRLRRDHGIEASLTIGFESGVISGAVVRAENYTEWSSFGPTVNLAARLQGACGQMDKCVLLGPGAWALVHHEVPTTFLDTIQLKGIADPMPVYSLKSDV